MPNQSKCNQERFWDKWERSGAVGWYMPPPCDQEIFRLGRPIALLDAGSGPAERWVRRVASKTKARIDWHYSGGVAQVLHLGDAASRERVIKAMQDLDYQLTGRIISFPSASDAGLDRAGVTPTPPDVLARFMDPTTGQAAYI